MVGRMVRVAVAAVVFAAAVSVAVMPVRVASADATPGPGVDVAVDYTVTLDGEYPPRYPFGENGATDPWGGWDHVFTADWHQGSWTVTYGGRTMAAYCLQVNNFRHPHANGGSPDLSVWNGSEKGLVKASYILWRWGATTDPLRAMAVSMLMHFYQSPNDRGVAVGVPLPDVNYNAVLDETVVFASSAYSSVPGMLSQMDGAANAWAAVFGNSMANVQAGVDGVRGGLLRSRATGVDLTPGMVEARSDGYVYTAGLAVPLSSPGQEQNVLVAGADMGEPFLPAVTADVHLRKLVSDDGSSWVNAQAGAPIVHGPELAPASPAAGSHDDGAPDAGDGVPVFRAADVSFRYELWLDAGSIEGVVSWPGGPAGVVTDDNGTPGDLSDDWSPAYVGGDDGDGFLEPGEVWVYSATDRLHTQAGQSYRNYASIPAGGVYDTLDRAAGPQMSSTARRDPAGFEVEPVSADVHFRKLVADDGSSWVNAQAGAPIAYDPELASGSPEAGSHDDGAPDAGDGVPVFRVGADVSFRYELWLDAGSDEGVVSWSGAPDGVVTDDNGTPGDPSDDWSPAYSAGDDGDGFLEPGEVWVYSAPEQKHTREGQSYRNYASIPAGVVYDTLDRGIPVWFSTPRSDPAGFEVVWLNSTTATAADGSHVLNPDGGVITDRVCYGGAVPGVQVTLEGEVLAVGADGTWAEPTGVEGSRRFTPSERSGCVEVEFDVPGDLPGNFVVFEDFKVGGRVVAVHHSVSDAAQSFRQQRRLGLSSEACHAWLTASHDGVASTCDVVVLSSGPEDAGLEVWGTVQAFPLDADGTRLCDSPGPKVEWSVTLDENGAGTVRTPEVVLPPGRWEWIEWGWLPDGRQSGRSCESGVQVPSEMFGVLPAGSQPSGGDPSGGIATTGSDTMTQLRGGAALAAVGLAMVLLASRRVRRRAVDELAG